MNLQQFNKDGIEVFVDTTSGETFASIRGYARMSGKPESNIRYRLKKGAQELKLKTAQIQTASGVQGAQLLTEDFIAEWLPKDNPEMATQVLKLGVRFFIHAIANFKQEAATPTPESPVSNSALLAMEFEMSLVQMKITLEKLKQENQLAQQQLTVAEPVIPEVVIPALAIAELPENFNHQQFMLEVYNWMYVHHYDISMMARALGTNRSTMRRMLQGYSKASAKIFCSFAELTDHEPNKLLSRFVWN